MEKSKQPLNTLAVRTLSGIVLLAVVLGAVLWSPVSFAALLLVITVGGMREYYRMEQAGGRRPLILFGTFAGALLPTAAFPVLCGIFSPAWLAVMLPAVMTVFIAELWRRSDDPAANIGSTLSGMVYVALPMTMLMAVGITGGEYRPWVVLTVIFTVWANDTGAYLVGSAVGRRRLFERISPKKSWEGFFGGLVFAVALAAVMGSCVIGGNALLWGGLGLVTAASGVLGDLAESMFKRAAGVKDSGAIMPGHGGWLDRFDALIMASPFVFTYFIIFTA